MSLPLYGIYRTYTSKSVYFGILAHVVNITKFSLVNVIKGRKVYPSIPYMQYASKAQIRM